MIELEMFLATTGEKKFKAKKFRVIHLVQTDQAKQ